VSRVSDDIEDIGGVCVACRARATNPPVTVCAECSEAILRYVVHGDASAKEWLLSASKITRETARKWDLIRHPDGSSYMDPIAFGTVPKRDDAKTRLQLQREGVEPNPGPRVRARSASVRRRSVSRGRVRVRVASKKPKRTRSGLGSAVGAFVPTAAGYIANEVMPGSGPLVATATRASMPAIMGAFGAIKSTISRIFGSGQYVVTQNKPSYNVLTNNQVPQFSAEQRGSTFVAHREFIQNVMSPSVASAFNVDILTFQPGLSEFLPWGHAQARLYQNYVVHGAVVEFVTYTSSYAAGGTLGAVIMAPQYNSLQPPPATKQQMEQLEGVVSAVTTSNQAMAFECAPSTQVYNSRYVRSGDVPAGQDARLYDFASLILAVDGVPFTDIKLGELWVSYLIEYRWPILQGPEAPPITNRASRMYADNPANLTGWDSSNMFAYSGNEWTIGASNPFGLTRTSGNRIDLSAVNATTSTPVLLRFTLQIKLTSTPSTTTPPQTNVALGMTSQNVFGVGGTISTHQAYGWDSPRTMYINTSYYLATSSAVALSYFAPNTATAAVSDAILLVEEVSSDILVP
jgi:hypothetical protein